MSYSDIVYIIGGYSRDEQSAVNWIQKYDFSQGISKIISETVYPRTGLSGTGKDGIYYYFGGVHDTSHSGQYLESWTYGSGYQGEIIDSHTTLNRINSAGEIVGNSLYVIGGNPYYANDSTSLSYIVEYNLVSKEFTEHSTSFNGLEDLPEQQMTAVIDHNIFIFGGLLNGISKDIYRFDTNEKKLFKLPMRLWEPRAGGSAEIYYEDNQIIIVGGFNESSNALNTTEIFSFSESSLTLKHGPELQIARAHNMAQRANGEIYVLGGYGIDGEHVKEIEKLVISTSIDVAIAKPSDYFLNQNYPNPFNPETKISFGLPQPGNVKIDVFDISGRQVSTLLDEKLDAGRHNISFEANDFKLASGIYIYRLVTDNFSTSRKMLLLK
ncbi:MAG: hypothetical protein SCALA702_11350 [Melioribacteraceae bacterium]|nr:MAG: hypothetical protein SCALA702_11350 [Melioribacteraceae bacterium]